VDSIFSSARIELTTFFNITGNYLMKKYITNLLTVISGMISSHVLAAVSGADVSREAVQVTANFAMLAKIINTGTFLTAIACIIGAIILLFKQKRKKLSSILFLVGVLLLILPLCFPTTASDPF
jgi:Na+-translocating ferredoxin:NAD+ oxidoreductase RnfD subunit